MAFSSIRNISQVAFEVSSTVYAFDVGSFLFERDLIGQKFDYSDDSGEFNFQNIRFIFGLSLGAPSQAKSAKGTADIVNYLIGSTDVYFYPAYRINGTDTTYAATKYKVRISATKGKMIQAKTAGIIDPYQNIIVETIQTISTIPDLFNF